MTLRMLDSITVANLPGGADAYAGYVDGAWSTILDLRTRFPHSRILSIAVFAADDAECLDVENGDATISEVFGWFTRQRKRGVQRPVIYTSAANLRLLLATMNANGFARADYRIWAAHYLAGEHICAPSSCGFPQADGTQWQDTALGLNGSLVDESLLHDSFFPAPPKPPPPSPARFHPQGDDMITIPPGAGGEACYLVPLFVPRAKGNVPPTVMRFASYTGADLEWNTGDTGNWHGFTVDFQTSPFELPLKGAAVIKVRRLDKGTNPVTADFA